MVMIDLILLFCISFSWRQQAAPDICQKEREIFCALKCCGRLHVLWFPIVMGSFGLIPISRSAKLRNYQCYCKAYTYHAVVSCVKHLQNCMPLFDLTL